MDHSGTFLLSELFLGTPPSCFDDVLAEDGEQLHVLPLTVHLNFFCDRQVGLTILDHSYFLTFFVGPLLHALKLGGGWWVLAYRILLSASVPFWVYLGWNWVGLGWDWVWRDWGLKGWGLGLDNIETDCSQDKTFFLTTF